MTNLDFVIPRLEFDKMRFGISGKARFLSGPFLLSQNPSFSRLVFLLAMGLAAVSSTARADDSGQLIAQHASAQVRLFDHIVPHSSDGDRSAERFNRQACIASHMLTHGVPAAQLRQVTAGIRGGPLEQERRHGLQAPRAAFADAR